MGYKNIIDLCEEAGGFNVLRNPDNFELILLSILEEAAKKLLNKYFIHFPIFKIITNDSSVYNGTARIIKNKKKEYNNYGIRIRYVHENISIKKSSLVQDGFSKAFSTYCHEMAHCFGGDSSSAFSLALTHIIEVIIRNKDMLQIFEFLWNNEFI